MYRINLIEASLYHHLEYTYKTTLVNQSLTTIDNIIYLSPRDHLLSLENLKLYKNGIEVEEGFTVYYPEGKIVFDVANQSDDQITLDASYCYMNIDTSFIGEFSLPKVIIDLDENIERPLEIGSKNRRIDTYYVEILIYSARKGEKNDLLNITKDSVRNKIPIINFNLGFPLNNDGTKNDSFTGPIVGYLEPENILIRDLGYVEVAGDVFAYVGLVECVFEEYLT
ncbi:MAG: hypothetical protein ACTSYR_04175 [Candidatus Odinarchaeia archaeon]